MDNVQAIKEAIYAKRPKQAFIFTHDNPDPDAIASAYGMKILLKNVFGIKSKIVYGGLILRDENVEMVRRLKIKLYKVDRLKISKKALLVLVDTQPKTGNNSFPSDLIPDIVIDHHRGKLRLKAEFSDVRDDIGACCSLVYGYLKDFNVEVDATTATAFFYGISSETQRLGRESSLMDRKNYIELFPRVKQGILAKIENPKRSREFFTFLELVIKNSQIYKNVLVSHIDNVPYPDIVSQFCDFLLSYERITWAMCYGFYQDKIVFSIRTQNRRARAGLLAARMVRKIGKAGGHDMIAGGWIRVLQGDTERSKGELVKRFLKSFGLKEDASFRPLTPETEKTSEEETVDKD